MAREPEKRRTFLDFAGGAQMIIIALTILTAAAFIGFLIWLADFWASAQWRQVQKRDVERRKSMLEEENTEKSRRFNKALQTLRRRFRTRDREPS